MNLPREELMTRILSQPTAPFREKHVITVVLEELTRAKVPFFADPAGNLVVGVSSAAEYRRLLKTQSREAVRIFIAHMDHPGFHGVKWRDDRTLEVKWHGGSPTAHLEGARVWLADREGWLDMAGQMTEAKLIESGRGIDTAVIRLEKPLPRIVKAPEVFGGFGFRAPIWEHESIFYTKAADDLIGVFAVVSLAMELFRKKKKGVPFIGLLTRAEEVGFIGAIAHFELGLHRGARRPFFCVSLETSRTLPGAEIGKGPVVRLGDRYTVFTPSHLRVFSDLAAKRFAGRHQRRIMDGGSCEASAATVYGLPCVGISVPLGNYHNQDLEGGPDARGTNGPAPEFVHREDVRGLLEMTQALMEPGLKWDDPWTAKRLEFKKSLKGYSRLMKSG